MPKPAAPLDLAAIASTLAVPTQVGARHLAAHTDNYSWLPDRSVDLVLCDPPFNIAQDTNFHTFEGNTINSYRFDADKGWDTYSQEAFLALMASWAREFARVLRPGGSFAVFCADSYVSHLKDALVAAGLHPRRTVTWRKPNAVPINRATMMMSACEYVVVGVKGSKATFNSDIDLDDVATLAEVEPVVVADKVGSVVELAVRAALTGMDATGAGHVQDVAATIERAVAAAVPEAVKRAQAMYVEQEQGTSLRACVPNFAEFNSKAGNRLHPTEKPVSVLRYLMALLSHPGDVVLDPFAGSGSTGEAAVLLDRRVVLVERDQEFFPKLSARLAALDVPSAA